MCGRFLFDGELDDIIERYNLSDTLEVSFIKKPEVCPTDMFPVVLNQGSNELRFMKWGLMQYNQKGVIINARSETAAQKAMFKSSLKSRRCIVPANAFYEWKTDEAGKKIRFRISVKGANLFSMAAIYNNFKSPEGQHITAFAILTTSANGPVSEIHDRMPVILDEASERLWLDNGIDEFETLGRLMKPYKDSEIMVAAG